MRRCDGLSLSLSLACAPSQMCFFTAWQLAQQAPQFYVNRTIGLIFSAVGGTAIRMWTPPEAFAKCGQAPASIDSIITAPPSPAIFPVSQAWRATGAVAGSSSSGVGVGPFPEDNSTLWNSMIAPLSRYAIRAVLWYQGEADSGMPQGYYACMQQVRAAS